MQLMPDSPIRRITLEIEAHAADTGWDQPPRLFALVSTTDLVDQQPDLLVEIGAGEEIAEGALTPVEQEDLPAADDFEQSLEQIGWPLSVAGCAAVIERIMLPPAAEESMPTDPAAVADYVAAHPDRQEVRIVAAVDRDGNAHSTVRARHTDEAELLEGPDLVPMLIELLRQTLAD